LLYTDETLDMLPVESANVSFLSTKLHDTGPG